MPEDIHSLYRRHGPAVLRRCRRLLRDERGAEEAMVEVFVRILANAADAPEPISTGWALRLATDTCLDRIRDQGRSPRDHDDRLLSRIAGLVSRESNRPSFTRRLLDRLLAARLRQRRLIAVLAYIDRLADEEIASELGLSPPRVRRTLRRLAQRWPEVR